VDDAGLADAVEAEVECSMRKQRKRMLSEVVTSILRYGRPRWEGCLTPGFQPVHGLISPSSSSSNSSETA
jgi:hypothetical protein